MYFKTDEKSLYLAQILKINNFKKIIIISKLNV